MALLMGCFSEAKGSVTFAAIEASAVDVGCTIDLAGHRPSLSEASTVDVG